MKPATKGDDRLRQLAVAVASVFYGTIAVGGRYFVNSGFSLLEVSLTGVLFGALLLGPMIAVIPAYRPRASDLGFFLLFGAAGAALQLTQFAGIVLGVPVALVVLLLYSQPIWTVIFARVWLQEAITRRKLGSVLLAVLGTVVLFDPFGQIGDVSVAGLLAAMAGGLMLSLWVMFSRVSGLRGNPALTTTFGYTAFTAVWLLAAYPLVRALLPEPAMSRLDPAVWARQWQAVAVYTLVGSVLPALLAMWGLRRVQASTAGILLLLEPISAAVLAYLFFGESLTVGMWLGGGLILLSNVVLIGRGRGSESP